MGKNSKAKRDAKAKTKRKQMRASVGGNLGLIDAGYDPGTYSNFSSPVPGVLFRKSCDECGSSDIEWTTVEDLASRGDEQQKRVKEIADWMGGEADGAEAWICSKCGNFGVTV